MESRRTREVVASFRTYEDAQAAVDRLSDEGFPVEGLAIEGRGVRMVERVTGRMTYGTAALQGALTGALIGLLIGLLFAAFSWFAPAESLIVLVLWSVLIGAVWGTLLGLLGHWLTRGRRDFSSVSGLVAESYDVTADTDVADEARRRLSPVRRTA
jgi:hypothetical protein